MLSLLVLERKLRGWKVRKGLLLVEGVDGGSGSLLLAYLSVLDPSGLEGSAQ